MARVSQGYSRPARAATFTLLHTMAVLRDQLTIR